MKTVKIILLFVITAIFGFSCESNTYEEISGEITNPTYTSNVKTIIDNNCVTCHNSNNQFPNLENYTQVKGAAQLGNLICRIDDQSCGSVMPPSGRMAQSTINTIKKWAANDYPN